MTHEIPELDRKSLRRFGLLTGAIVLGLFGLVLPWLLDRAYPIWPWVVSSVLWGWALLHPTTLRPVYRIWMRIGMVLGWINTWLMLGVVFFAVVLPMGLTMRIFGKDPMARRFDGTMRSYRVKSTNPSRDNLTRPF
jgi:hypothetical protein